MYFLINYLCIICLSFIPNEENEWKYLFNGSNLDGWKIKIRGHELGDNYNNTFKVRDGSIKISYENYEFFEFLEFLKMLNL